MSSHRAKIKDVLFRLGLVAQCVFYIAVLGGVIMLFSQGGTDGTVCADGWMSQSSGSGTCSWHGGVR